MIEYYHPESGKSVKIEKSSVPGGVTTVIETFGNTQQSLNLREQDVEQFVQSLVNNGWLERQML